MPDETDKLDEPSLLIQLTGPADVLTNTGRYKAKLHGELVLGQPSRTPDVRAISVERFGLAIEGVKARNGPTGTISVVGEATTGSRCADRRETLIDLRFRGQISYDSLDEARGVREEARCFVLPAFDPVSIRISLRLAQREGKQVVTAGQVTVAAVEGLREILAISVPFSDVTARAVNSSGGDVHFEANTPYDPCIQVNRRTLTCRPVAFQASATDTAPSGGSIAAQFATAQTVWNRACITIDVLPTHMITDAALKTSDQWPTIMNSFTDSAPNVIEVFFVANSLLNVGGGVAYVGTATAKAVIGEPNGPNGNPVLLAHELGHVLGLRHPPQTGSESGTVLDPTGSAMIAGTEDVLHAMAQAISNPALVTTTPCCLSHDVPDHYIRDFPVDAGQEPSDPLPSGMTRYSMSDVWNRTTNTPGAWSATTGPQHESPYRFQNDGVTPATNYFFAKVQQLNNFSVIGAQVNFYLKTPGSGSGSIALIGSSAVSVAFGGSTDVSIPWSVPALAPVHSCCFAVVASPAEPEGTQSNLNWSQFEDMCRQDNDWAQRNLDIVDVSPNMGSGNAYDSAPWLIDLPEAADLRKVPLTLRVAVVGAGAQAAEIDVPGAGCYRLEPGRTQVIKTNRTLSPGERCAVVLRATLAQKAKRGAAVGILVDPMLGDRELVGFGTTFRLAGDRPAKRMFLDRAIAAAWDVADSTDEDHWHQLAFDLRALAGDRTPHLRELARRILAIKSLPDCVGLAGRWPLAETFGLPAAGKRLLGGLKRSDLDGVNASLWSFLTRAHMAVPVRTAG